MKFKHKNLNSLNLPKLPDFNFLLCEIENNDLEKALKHYILLKTNLNLP